MEYVKKYWWLVVVAVVAYIVYLKYKAQQPEETELSKYQKLVLDISRMNPVSVGNIQAENLRNFANSGNVQRVESGRNFNIE